MLQSVGMYNNGLHAGRLPWKLMWMKILVSKNFNELDLSCTVQDEHKLSQGLKESDLIYPFSISMIYHTVEPCI